MNKNEGHDDKRRGRNQQEREIDMSKVVTYTLAWEKNKEVSLCALHSAHGEANETWDGRALGPVRHGLHSGLCDHPECRKVWESDEED